MACSPPCFLCGKWVRVPYGHPAGPLRQKGTTQSVGFASLRASYPHIRELSELEPG